MKSRINLILKLLEQSVDLVYQNDKYLIKHSVHEQDISHRIAFYFENLLGNYAWFTQKGYSVDVEYNKNFEDSKRVYKQCSDCQLEHCYIKNSGYNIGDYIQICRPDIILHKRGKNNNSYSDYNNLLVIEVKKNDPSSEEDFAKLSAFTCKNSDYKYNLGIYINLNTKTPEYFQNGKKLSKESDIVYNYNQKENR